MEPNTWRGRDTFWKILSLPICASCMPNVLAFRRVLQHPRKRYFPTVRDSNVWDRKLHEIVNDKSQRVISSVLSSTKSLNESRVCERCTLRKLGNLGKNTFLLLQSFYFQFLTFYICVCDLYLIDNVVLLYLFAVKGTEYSY